jgi:hypothetical protein
MSEAAKACPQCGAPRTKQSSGCGTVLLIGVAVFVLVAIFGSPEPTSTAASAPRSKPVFDHSPKQLAERKSAIQQAIAAGLFTKVGVFSAGSPEIWVTQLFLALSFDDKQTATAGVWGYFFDGSAPHRRLFLVDSQTGKRVGEFSLKRGLKID